MFPLKDVSLDYDDYIKKNYTTIVKNIPLVEKAVMRGVITTISLWSWLGGNRLAFIHFSFSLIKKNKKQKKNPSKLQQLRGQSNKQNHV